MCVRSSYLCVCVSESVVGNFVVFDQLLHQDTVWQRNCLTVCSLVLLNLSLPWVFWSSVSEKNNANGTKLSRWNEMKMRLEKRRQMFHVKKCHRRRRLHLTLLFNSLLLLLCNVNLLSDFVSHLRSDINRCSTAVVTRLLHCYYHILTVQCHTWIYFYLSFCRPQMPREWALNVKWHDASERQRHVQYWSTFSIEIL